MWQSFRRKRGAMRSGGKSTGDGFRRDFGHVEQLESRAVLSAVSVAIVPPAVQDGSSVVAPSLPGSPVAAARLLLRVPPQVEAGVPTPIIATAIDAAGRAVPSLSGSATVFCSDGAAALPNIEVRFKDGRASFEVTFATAGRQTVSVKMLSDDPSGSLAARAATMVTVPRVATTFSILLPKAAPVGVPVVATIVATDAQGRTVPTFNGTATLASSDSAATLPNSVRFVAGRATVRVTFGTLGEQTLTAFRVWSGPDGVIAGSAKTQVGELTYQRVATTFAVVLPKAVPAGVPVLVTILATDAQGIPVPTFSGTATLASSDTAAKLPPSARFVAGRATVRVTFGTLGEQTLTAFRVWSGPGGVISGTGKTQVGEVTIQRR